MSWIRQLERRLRPFAVPNLTMILIAGMVLAYLLSVAAPHYAAALTLRPQAILRGEFWRLLTFPFMPSTLGATPDEVRDAINPVSMLFFFLWIMFLHLMGSALESTWGTLRFNLFFLIGYVASVGGAVVASLATSDDAVGSNFFFYESVFLAFAYLYPEFEILAFFFIPVKVRWVGLISVVLLGLQFLHGLATFTNTGWLTCVLIAAATLNLFVFLGRDIASRIRSRNARMLRRFQEVQQKQVPRHTCCVCGVTNLSNPEREFRYCTQCDGAPAYCDLHLKDHVHRTKAPAAGL